MLKTVRSHRSRLCSLPLVQVTANSLPVPAKRLLHHLPHSGINNEIKVDVKAGLKDRLAIHIRPAPRPSASSPIIIYIPPGIIDETQSSAASTLALSANATVARLDYRLSGARPYPCAIHDVLAGYDWVKKHLITGSSGEGHPNGSPTTSSIGVCGQLLGGSLAAAVGLTECHTGKTGIGALAIGNATVDWTQLGPPPNDAAGARVRAAEKGVDLLSQEMTRISLSDLVENAMDIDNILRLRSSTFPKAALYYDPFASPLLFFRTPTYDLPPRYIDMFNTEEDTDPSDDPENAPQRKRRSYRKYPPTGLKLQVPRMRIEYGEDNILAAQSQEFAHLVKRSLKVAEEDMWGLLGKKDLAVGIETTRRSGLGLWGEGEFAELGAWFGKVLRPMEDLSAEG